MRVGFYALRSVQMGGMLCLVQWIRQFECGVQRPVNVYSPSKVMNVKSTLLCSLTMDGVLSLVPLLRQYRFGMQIQVI